MHPPALDRRTDQVERTKGMHNRRVPIEPALMPLLVTMYAKAQGQGRVLPDYPSGRDMARGLGRWLRRAGVARAELFEKSATGKQLTFHDLRATGITWLAVRGGDPLKIQQWAGHEHFSTTQGYIRTAEAVAAGFGEPFPALPEIPRPSDTTEKRPSNRTRQSFTAAQVVEIRRGGRDSPAADHSSAHSPRS
jgi:hypothetical protein